VLPVYIFLQPLLHPFKDWKCLSLSQGDNGLLVSGLANQQAAAAKTAAAFGGGIDNIHAHNTHIVECLDRILDLCARGIIRNNKGILV
jgi:hypothetical protein